ncbi:hypothetical protein P8C59_007835 [Phyllachora maydis]|uniref:Uncharacterized protein n=1 Tax=Phyllachora maydis TaxID=1825666 RepID=A0AAD9I9I1_9PEZI|nr:hypothetical protein P8C59_007835 [Phyllachora maydis]
MPPRSSLTSSFSITDSNNEVVCPLRNQDGSSCRKRCLGEKRYRSMQEHIRRAHPEHYISKLPATEESFLLMINTPPSERPQTQANPAPPHMNQAKGSSHPFHRTESSGASGTPRHGDEYGGGALFPAAAALAQLHAHKAESAWEPEVEWHSDTERAGRMPRSSIELPPIHLNSDVTSLPFPPLDAIRQRDTLPTVGQAGRPRKQSVTKRSSHQRRKSKGVAAEWLKRLQNDASHLLPPGGHDRKALSAEPPGDFGKRWEDLIDAAASATEDIDEDRTPVPRSPISIHRASLPPFPQHTFQHGAYQASPLQQALTPPSYNPEAPDPFPA